MHILAVQRAARFSPRSEERDEAILRASVQKLLQQWPTATVQWMREEVWTAPHFAPHICLSMARSEEVLTALDALQQQGCYVVNSGQSVRAAQRSALATLMEQHHIPTPSAEGKHGWWVKRGDEAAQDKDDVVFCDTSDEVIAAKQRLYDRGAKRVVVQAHVVGDLVKFYGVTGQMFVYRYPTEGSFSKFGLEQHNGSVHHWTFNEAALHQEAERLAGLTGLSVYGGDAIVEADGRFWFIDFNDWPSFSSCREEAAQAVARLVANHWEQCSLQP